MMAGLMLLAGLVLLTGAYSLPLNITAAPTVSFSCLTQAQALLLIATDAPGGMVPDGGVMGCSGLWDGYYTPGGNSFPSCPPECVTTSTTTLKYVNSGVTSSTVFTTTPTVTVTQSGTTTTITLVSTTAVATVSTSTTTATTTTTVAGTATTVTRVTTVSANPSLVSSFSYSFLLGVILVMGSLGLFVTNRKRGSG